MVVLRPSFEHGPVELKLGAIEDVVFTTDADRVRQILVNLLSNALKFTPNGSVTVSAERVERNVRFSVTDTGVGIARDHMEKVFEAFWQADQSDTRRYNGTGLGLAVSRRLARQLGGGLRVESELGQGSTFILELPNRTARRGITATTIRRAKQRADRLQLLGALAGTPPPWLLP